MCWQVLSTYSIGFYDPTEASNDPHEGRRLGKARPGRGEETGPEPQVQGIASISLWVPTKGRAVWMESNAASLGSAGLGLPLLPKYQRRESREQGLGRRNCHCHKVERGKGTSGLGFTLQKGSKGSGRGKQDTNEFPSLG